VRAGFPFLHAVDVDADALGQFLLFPAEGLPSPPDRGTDSPVASRGVFRAHALMFVANSC
jgi:hypothetical protein